MSASQVSQDSTQNTLTAQSKELPTWRRIVNRFTNELGDFYDELRSQVEDEEFENPMHCETIIKLLELKDLLKEIE